MLQHFLYSSTEVKGSFTELLAPSPAARCRLPGAGAMQEAVPALTCPHDVLHAGEALVDGGADGAQDEHAAQVAVAHQRAAQEPPVLVLPVHVAGDQVHDAVRPGNALVLSPPAGHHQGHVET